MSLTFSLLNLLELTTTRNSTEKIKPHFFKLFSEQSVVFENKIL